MSAHREEQDACSFCLVKERGTVLLVHGLAAVVAFPPNTHLNAFRTKRVRDSAGGGVVGTPPPQARRKKERPTEISRECEACTAYGSKHGLGPPNPGGLDFSFGRLEV